MHFPNDMNQTLISIPSPKLCTEGHEQVLDLLSYSLINPVDYHLIRNTKVYVMNKKLNRFSKEK
jgi:hypothetical protein